MEYTVEAVHQEGLRFVAKAGPHSVTTDYPLIPGEGGAGARPLELLWPVWRLARAVPLSLCFGAQVSLSAGCGSPPEASAVLSTRPCLRRSTSSSWSVLRSTVRSSRGRSRSRRSTSARSGPC